MKNDQKSIMAAISLIGLACIIIALLFTSDPNLESPSLHMIYVPKKESTSNDFWATVVAGAEVAARENNVDLEIFAPEDEIHIEQQNEFILAAVEKHPSVIVVSPSSQTENLEALKAVKEAGIPLVYIDSRTDEAIEDALVATDNVAAGAKMAEPMLSTLTKDSKIGIVSHVKNSSTAIEREKGFRQGLGEYESQIVEVVYSQAMADVGYEVTKELLQRQPDITYLACLNEDSTVGAGRAVEELGLTGKICMVGFDNAVETIQKLEAGVFNAIVVQRTFSMGYFGIENAARVVRGEMIEHTVDSGSVLITKDNMYEEENQELLFPFYNQE